MISTSIARPVLRVQRIGAMIRESGAMATSGPKKLQGNVAVRNSTGASVSTHLFTCPVMIR